MSNLLFQSIQLHMINSKTLLLLLSFLILLYSQTFFPNTCSTNSLLNKLATGVINLNPQDTYNNGANKDYYVDLTKNQFAAIDVLGYAFALSGFQTPCGQPYYTLSIDKVYFDNQNTRMRIIANFKNSISANNGTITSWNLVTFTYIVVSRSFSTASSSDIWASTAQLLNPVNNAAVSIDTIGAGYSSAVGAGDTNCGIYRDPNYILGDSCVQTDKTTSAGLGGQAILHVYVMGFRFNPLKTNSSYLGFLVSVQNPITTSNANQQLTSALINLGATPNGPIININNFNTALQYIKIGFVLSRFQQSVKATTYPFNNDKTAPTSLIYSASHVWTPVTTFNASVPLANQKPASYNSYFYPLPDTRYVIYGLLGFNIPTAGNGVNCSSLYINSTLNSAGNSYIVNTFSNTLNGVYFGANIFTKKLQTLCNVASPPTVLRTFGPKSFSTVPASSSTNQYVKQNPITGAPVFTLPYGTAGSDAIPNDIIKKSQPIYLAFYGGSGVSADNLVFTAQLPYTNIIPNQPVYFNLQFFDQIGDMSAGDSAMILNSNYSIQLDVSGFTLFSTTYVRGANPKPTSGLDDFSGSRIINSNTANAVITVRYTRSTSTNQNLWVYLRAYQYTQVYDPTTGCCSSTCANPSSGINVLGNPLFDNGASTPDVNSIPVCVSCDTSSGLVYNPATGNCTCLSGFYLDTTTSTSQCYPCTSAFCSVCNPTNPLACITCQIGATLNPLTQNCTCGAGYFINGTRCQQCPLKCNNCTSPNGQCISCNDPTRRILNANCACILGFYDAGLTNCVACPSTCQTCSSATSCLTCDSTKFRTFNNSVCNCIPKYYQLINADQTRSCQPCSPICLTCQIAPTSCTSCDSTKNRFPGIDAAGRSTCVCQVGFYSNITTGQCIQTNCTADPTCSQCLNTGGLQVCVQCQSSLFRVVQNPAGICVCANGFFQNSAKSCVPCSSGCATCTSATNCLSCVQLATPNSNGTCACPSQTFFTIAPSGVRYCAPCVANCAVCSDASTCTTCLPGLNLVQNQCLCPTNSFVNSNGSCSSCPVGCSTCNSTACLSCSTPLVLQGTQCQNFCNNGTTLIGGVCTACPAGCLQCTQSLTCYYCNDNLFAYKGNCFTACPSGTMGTVQSGNQICVPCNSPCATCSNHPSFCTSCTSGQGFLQTSGTVQNCVSSCNDGTFASNGICRICSFNCATCVGAADYCLTCSDGMYLYQGKCVSTCPGILNGNVCSVTCPPGFYNISSTSCSPCASTCLTCSNSASTCTSCTNGLFVNNGTCSSTCPANTFAFVGICTPCSVSCNGCSSNPTNCTTCASGYVRSGSICQQGCPAGQYSSQGVCQACSSTCATCSSANTCLTCANPNIQPNNGVCSQCVSNCAVCNSASTACVNCQSGFFLLQGICLQACPSGFRTVGGSCLCQNGFVFNSQCIANCPIGFYGSNGQCLACNSNCQTCAITPTNCVSCLVGFTLNTTSNSCVQNSVNPGQISCPFGQAALNGVCLNICQDGFFFFQGICIFGSCFSGYVSNGFGGCVQQTNPPPTVSCPPGQFLSTNGCVSTCPNGFYPDSTVGRCLVCSSNCLSCFSANFCTACQTGFDNINGVCIQTTSCQPGQFLFGNVCVASCPAGTFQTNSQCIRTCPINTYYYSQFCYADCPTGLRTGEACVTNCPGTTRAINGICL